LVAIFLNPKTFLPRTEAMQLNLSNLFSNLNPLRLFRKNSPPKTHPLQSLKSLHPQNLKNPQPKNPQPKNPNLPPRIPRTNRRTNS